MYQERNRAEGSIIPVTVVESALWRIPNRTEHRSTDSIDNLRVELLTRTLFKAEERFAPQILDMTKNGSSNHDSSKHPRKRIIEERVLEIVENDLYQEEENNAFNTLKYEGDEEKALRMLKGALWLVNDHLKPHTQPNYTYQPDTTSFTLYWGMDNLARIVASETYLLSECKYSWEKLKKEREKIFKAIDSQHRGYK